MNSQLTLEDVRNILADIKYRYDDPAMYCFHAEEMGDGFSVQIQYWEEDVTTPGVMALQTGRKWYVGSMATKSEVVQTALKAALASAEHQTREHFLYRDLPVYGPHMDVDFLHASMAAEGDPTDARQHLQLAGGAAELFGMVS